MRGRVSVTRLVARTCVGGLCLMGLWGMGSRQASQSSDATSGQTHDQGTIRAPAVADQFYPGDPQQLTQMVDQLLAAAPNAAVDGELVGLMLPHAGYVFSGGIAAAGVKLLQGQAIDVVILVGVAHRVPVEGAAVFPPGAFDTPLGRIPIDGAAVAWLSARTPLIQRNIMPHEDEHSLEVELPLLQRALGSFQIVPLVMGNPELATCRTIGEAIAALASRYTDQGRRWVIIASTDLSHYPSEADAHVVDARLLTAVLGGEAAQVQRVSQELMRHGYENLLCTLCGEGAVKTVMSAAQQLGATRVTQLGYATSADVPQGAPDRVVGYAAMALTRPRHATAAPPAWRGEEQRLLTLARQALARYLNNGQRPHDVVDVAWPPALAEPAAVFVTLRRGRQLRGCIGTTEPRAPLGVAVQHYAIAAASEDGRFPPVSAQELSDVSIEISVLSPLTRVAHAAAIQPHRHGVAMRRGGRFGLLLPQVWEDTGWTREQFLRQLASQKAGLPPNAWNDPATELYVFTVDIFAE